MWETVWEVDSKSLYSQANTKVSPQGNTKQFSGTSVGPTASPEALQLLKISHIVVGNNLDSIKLPKVSNISTALAVL